MRLATCAFALTLSTIVLAAPAPDELRQVRDQLRAVEAKNDYTAAVPLAEKLVDVATKRGGRDGKEAVSAREDLARDLYRADEYLRSLDEYRQLAALAEQQHGESKELISALIGVTIPLGPLQRYDEVEALERRAVEMSKKIHGEHSDDYLHLLGLLASTLFYQRNDYTGALQVYDQILRLGDEQGAKGIQTQYANALQIGQIYWELNQRPRAIALFDRALQLADKLPNPSADAKAQTIWQTAQIYHFGGRDDLAKPLAERALALYDQQIAQLDKDKPDDWRIPMLLVQSAGLKRTLNDYAGAKQRMERAIALDDKKHGSSTTRLMLADLEESQGHFKEALALYETQSAWIAKAIPNAATEYNVQMARVLLDLGDYKRGEKLVQDRMAFADKAYGRHYPLYYNGEFQLGMLYAAAGDVTSAVRAFGHSYDEAERQLQIVLHTGTDNDHAQYFRGQAYWLDNAINFNARLAPTSAPATRLALTTLLRRKGRLLDASAEALATIRRKLSPEDKKLLDQLQAARTKLAQLTIGGAHGDAAANAKQVAALEDQIQKLELELGKKSAAYRASSVPIELAAIQKQIPADARLVEVVNYEPSDLKKTQRIGGVREPRRYAAYVVGRTGEPVFVELGAAADIDQAVEKFRKAIANPDDDRAGELGHALYTLTMAKIAPALKGATHVLLAPDGSLNVVPFSALVDDKGEFLVKKLTFTYLTSGRDLLRLAVKTKAQGGGVVIADPSFDATGAKPDGKPAGSRGRRSLDIATMSWKPLPGTGKEADAVAKTWQGLKVLRGADATEGAVKQVRGPKILHLATHGFFLPDEEVPVETAVGVDARENPLLRSGLVLAGANKLASGDEDGILTALEASGLDLQGTKLVVLSACETGVGKVTNGDGVYGLRRALVIAGAESLVMSMWQVDDEATKDLMVGYYQRLAAGKPRSSALREVQTELMARDRYKHPYYWASFLATGDDSPVQE